MRNRRLLLPVSLSSIALGAGLVVAGVAAAPSANAQQLSGAFPFPSTNLDASRLKTDAITTYEIEDLYRKWVADTIRSCANDVRIVYTENNPQDTRSEGIGYGMVIAAYMGDQATFEGLWSFYQRHSNQGLMDWLLNDCDNVGDGGSAADADIDAALALIVADRQFPNQGYANDARTLLNAVRTRLVEPANRGGNCNGILLPGSNYTGCGCVNPSYIPPGYYAAYAAFDTANATSWTNARNASYTLLAQAQNDTSGFVPAWSTSTGSTQLQNCAFQVAGGGQPDEYQSDAARTPWRVATDYAWTGEPRAAQFLNVLDGFVTGLPRVRIIDRYTLQGQGLGDNVASAFGRRGSFHMGGFATAMIASSQEDLDSFTGAWNSIYRAGDLINEQTLRAYNGSLALLYALLVTGTMWNPTGAAPTPLPEPALPSQGDNILVNGDFTAGLRGWTTQSLSNPDSGDDSDGYMVHKAGEIHARVLKIQADRAYGIQFYQDVALQAGQNYLVSLKARAAAPRPIRLVIGEVDDFDNNGQAYESYATLRDGDGDTFNVTAADATYSFVFTQPVTNPGARVNLQFGDAMDEVVFDDVSITPTTLPPTEIVGVEGGGAVIPDPANPGTGTPNPGGNPTTPAGNDGTIGTVNPGSDPGSGSNPGAAPGVPNPNDSTAGLPPAPTTAPGAASCTAQTATACAPAACSIELQLCYDPTTGYVWDPSQNTYTQPPRGVQGCAADQVYWPKFGYCYIPETGWIYNPTVMPPAWQFYGIDYTEGKKPEADDSGCSISGVAGGEAGSKWLLVGLLGAALGLTYRRRSA
jgi:endo-1,4-beta-D-glucanase Y